MIRRQVFMVLLVAVSLVLTCVIDAQAQGRRGGQGGQRGQRGGQGGFGQRGGMMFGGGGMRGGATALLGRKDVQEELELVDDQIKEIQGIEAGGDMRSMMGDLRDLPREEMMEKFREMREQQQKKVQSQLDKILLPHQSKRLKQLTFQSQMRAGGGALLMGSVAEQLNVTDSQRDELREKFQEIQADMQKELAALQAKARDKLLKELSPAQQRKYKDLMGSPFEFKDEPRRGPGGQPGGRGGRGGRDI